MTRPTVVTCLFDLSAREPGGAGPTVEEYLNRGELVLGLDADLVCFAEPSIAGELRARRDRAGLAGSTEIVEAPFESLPSHELLRAATEARRHNPLINGRPVDTALHAVVHWAKYDMLAMAMRSNPFGAERFAWVDFGLGHVAKAEHHVEDRVFTDLPEGVRLLQVEALDEPLLLKDRAHHLSYRRDKFSDRLIGGSADRMAELCELVREQLELALSDGFAPTGEQLLELAVGHRPKLFSFHYGDFDHIVENYRRPRGAAVNLLSQLRRWRHADHWQLAAEQAGEIIESVAAGTFVSKSTSIAALLEECFLVSYYAHKPDQTQARAAATLYLELANRDPLVREHLMLHEVRVRTNFAFVEA